MKKTLSFVLIVAMILIMQIPIYAVTPFSGDGIDARSAILIDGDTGTVLFELNADEAYSPASVTKVMTMLLVLEAIDSGNIALTDVVTVSANAAGKGGSQVYLAEGEQMTVDELMKCMIVSSANDAATALAEYVCGSEATFIARMNERAAELGCKSSHFENATGLDDTATNHVMTARDIATISAAVISHPLVFNYSTIWMDTIRNGAFGLSNTNRLIRFYDGATGLKTGSTSRAGFCISATASRDGLNLIAVIMGSSTRDARNALAKSMLDYGYANYAAYNDGARDIGTVDVVGGTDKTVAVKTVGFGALLQKGEPSKVEAVTELYDNVAAPVAVGDKVGTVTYKIGDRVIGTADIVAVDSVDRVTFFTLLPRLWRRFILCK